MEKFEDTAKDEWAEFLLWAKTPPLPSLPEVHKRRIALVADGWGTEQEFRGPESPFYDNGPDESGQAYTSNHTGYDKPGSHNWEHDDTGSAMNYSGVVDEFVNAQIENEGLEKGFDYD